MPPRLNKRGGVQGWGDTANEDIMLIKIIVYLDVNKWAIKHVSKWKYFEICIYTEQT